jgi:tRNA(Ile)-lysidine synthase
MSKHFGFSLDQCTQAIAVSRGQSGKKFLSTTHQLVIDREEMIITPHADLYKEKSIGKNDTDIIFGPWNMKMEISNDIALDSNSFQAHLDADKVKFPLIWRQWREGDFFYPLGMDQRKKVSDFLIDTKVPLSDKAAVTVIESEDEIIWVVGYRISNRFKITSDTKRSLRFLLIPYFV